MPTFVCEEYVLTWATPGVTTGGSISYTGWWLGGYGSVPGGTQAGTISYFGWWIGGYGAN